MVGPPAHAEVTVERALAPRRAWNGAIICVITSLMRVDDSVASVESCVADNR